MSYLARMLARAQEEPGAGATPRLPSWFEQAPQDPTDGPEESRAAERPASAGDGRRTVARRDDADRADSAHPGRTGLAPLQPPTAGQSVLPRSAALRSSADRQRPDDPQASAAAADAAFAPTARDPAAVQPAGAAPAASAPAPATAVPAVPRPVPSERPDAQAVAQPPSQPATVEVAIGRIEVRATIARPPAPPVRPSAEQPPTPAVLSLADYLAGKRGAR